MWAWQCRLKTRSNGQRSSNIFFKAKIRPFSTSTQHCYRQMFCHFKTCLNQFKLFLLLSRNLVPPFQLTSESKHDESTFPLVMLNNY